MLNQFFVCMLKNLCCAKKFGGADATCLLTITAQIAFKYSQKYYSLRFYVIKKLIGISCLCVNTYETEY